MALAIGTQLGSMEVTALFGRGSMGEVYGARDTKLKRDFAQFATEEAGFIIILAEGVWAEYAISEVD